MKPVVVRTAKPTDFERLAVVVMVSVDPHAIVVTKAADLAGLLFEAALSKRPLDCDMGRVLHRVRAPPVRLTRGALEA